MKKIATLILLLPLAIVIISVSANAQRKNTTSHDVATKIEAQSEDIKLGCKCDCGYDHHKKHKKHNNKKKNQEEKTSQK